MEYVAFATVLLVGIFLGRVFLGRKRLIKSPRRSNSTVFSLYYGDNDKIILHNAGKNMIIKSSHSTNVCAQSATGIEKTNNDEEDNTWGQWSQKSCFHNIASHPDVEQICIMPYYYHGVNAVENKRIKVEVIGSFDHVEYSSVVSQKKKSKHTRVSSSTPYELQAFDDDSGFVGEWDVTKKDFKTSYTVSELVLCGVDGEYEVGQIVKIVFDPKSYGLIHHVLVDQQIYKVRTRSLKKYATDDSSLQKDSA